MESGILRSGIWDLGSGGLGGRHFLNFLNFLNLLNHFLHQTSKVDLKNCSPIFKSSSDLDLLGALPSSGKPPQSSQGVEITSVFLGLGAWLGQLSRRRKGAQQNQITARFKKLGQFFKSTLDVWWKKLF